MHTVKCLGNDFQRDTGKLVAPYAYVSLTDSSNIYLWFSIYHRSPENRMIIGKGLDGDMQLIHLNVFLLDIEKTIFLSVSYFPIWEGQIPP